MNSYRPMKRNTIINKCLKNGEPVHHYIISKNIGRGGSGFTYLAQDETGKPCVIKEYIPFNNRYSFVRNSNDVLVFNSTVSESQKKTITNKLIQIAAHEYDINHKAMITEAGDNSPYIFDFTTFSDTSSDVIYGLIQTVEGEVFSEYITHITTEEKIHLLLKVSDAIKYINSRGILHADLTPENIYVNSMGQVQILDFGASMDIGKFRRGTTEDKKKFARNLLSTNVGSFSRYYCSENLLTFANSINFVSNDNESDINKIVDILSNNISYADDIYSFKQIILFTLIGAPEAKIYLSSMTVEEYICDRSWLIKWLVTHGFYKYSPKIRRYCLTYQAACTDAILIEGFLFLILWNITYNEMDKARKKVLLFNCFSIAGLGIISFFLHPFN